MAAAPKLRLLQRWQDEDAHQRWRYPKPYHLSSYQEVSREGHVLGYLMGSQDINNDRVFWVGSGYPI